MKTTQRERELLRLINSNPMISQDQLAKKLDITRSSVGVHISNMVRKKIRWQIITKIALFCLNTVMIDI